MSIMDVRTFKVREPEPSELFAGCIETCQDGIQEFAESCKVAKHVISMFTDDTRSVQEAGSRIATVIDKWRESDDVLHKLCDEIMKTGMDMREICDEIECVSTSECVKEIKTLRDNYANSASKTLQSVVNATKDAFTRRRIALSTLQGCHVERSCPICMNQEPDTFMVPCGHVTCSKCAEKVVERCFVCRSQIISKNKLFI